MHRGMADGEREQPGSDLMFRTDPLSATLQQRVVQLEGEIAFIDLNLMIIRKGLADESTEAQAIDRLRDFLRSHEPVLLSC